MQIVKFRPAQVRSEAKIPALLEAKKISKNNIKTS